MKQKRINPQIWREEWFVQLSEKSKLLYMYLLTNEYIGLSGYMKLTDRVIMFDTGLSPDDLQECKKELFPKVLFTRDWVHVTNVSDHDPIKGENNNLWVAYDKEIDAVPNDIKREFESFLVQKEENKDDERGLQGALKPLASPIGGAKGKGKGKGGIAKGGNSEIDKKSPPPWQSREYLLKIPDTDVQSMVESFSCVAKHVHEKGRVLHSYCQSKGKKYKDYRAFLRNALYRDYGERPKPQTNSPSNPLDSKSYEEGRKKIEKMRKNILFMNPN